jgi:hypothetical protein
MKSRSRGLAACAAAALAGCAATNPPLMFGDSTTIGLRLGNDTTSAGGSVSFGYKAQSIALVPVSLLDEHGDVELLKAGDSGAMTDALSVFASFTASAPPAGAAASAPAMAQSAVHLGQLFSTGIASQSLAEGICRANGLSCVKAPASDFRKTARMRTAASTDASASAPAVASGPYQKPLLFMRTDVYGIDIGGGLAQQGLQFTLGYNNRNLALIPVAATDAHGRSIVIAGKDGKPGNDGQALDTLSVLGQFKADTETSRLNVGLERYFSTGVAARYLGQAIGNVAVVAANQAASTPAPAAQAVGDPGPPAAVAAK